MVFVTLLGGYEEMVYILSSRWVPETRVNCFDLCTKEKLLKMMRAGFNIICLLFLSTKKSFVVLIVFNITNNVITN